MRYLRTGLLLSALLLSFSPAVALSRRAQSPTAAPEVGASWSYTNFGSGIGASGLVLDRNGAFREIAMGGTLNIFGSNDYWYVLRYSPSAQQYEQVFASEVMPSKIVRIGTGDLFGDGRTEIVAALESGEIRLYDQITRSVLPGLTVPSSIASMVIHDLDGDGKAEIILTASTGLVVYSGAGTFLWGLNQVFGTDLAVGQMDDDLSLEITATDGKVVDVETQTVQWSSPTGFGVHVLAGDIDGDGRDELIVGEGWNAVRAYDVDTKLEKWTIATPQDVGAIGLVDTDCDGELEVLIGDGQWGSVRAYDAASRALKWEIPNPEHGVTWIAFGDVDGDGNAEVVWGAGATYTGPDHLFFGDPITESIEWQSIDLSGPFLGPEIGDVDGDGEPELVFVTRYSDAQYGAGRILVLDGKTLRLRAMSDPIAPLVPIPSLLLRNVDADPALEIVLAGGAPYDGLVQIYDFTPPGTFTLNWSNDSRPFGSWFFSVDTGDVDADGKLEIVAGGGRAHTGADGTFLYVYDYETGAVEWTSPQLGGMWDNVQDVAIVDGGTESPDLVAIVGGGALYAFDGVTHAAFPEVPGAFTAMRAAPFSGVRTVYLGDGAGKVYRYERGASGYTLAATYTLGLPGIDGITLPPSGGALIGSAGRLRFYPDLNGSPAWTTLDFGDSFGHRACLGIGLHARVLSGGLYGVFEVGPGLGVSDISPSSGPSTGGTSVAVTGSGFSAGASVFLAESAVEGVVVGGSSDLSGSTPALPAGTLASLTVLDADGSEGILPDAFFVDFADVDGAHLFHAAIEGVARRRVTAGCGGGNFCPTEHVTRSQMAVFLVRAAFGSSFQPPQARGQLFSDVSCGGFGADEIEWIATRGITAGCGGGAYCVSSPVTRAQMAVFLLKTLEGAAYVPPPAQGVFADVPAADPFAPWIEDLSARGITAGCGGGNYCPANATTRGQMAVFLSRTFFAP
jgi:hypothetical protein